ncbi:MAG: transporter [Bacteroidetes bacterium]|nr:transporter [Bacteroidota bacterium]
MQKEQDKLYEKKVVYLFFLIWGFTFFNRLSINFVMPVIQENLKLTAANIGIINLVSVVVMAVSSMIIGRLSDKSGKRKKYLIPATVLIGLASMSAIFVTDITGLFVIRILVGIGLGPILPMIFSLTESASGENKFGQNTGIIMAGDALIANIIGPTITTWLTSFISWQLTLCITAIPTIIVAILGFKIIKESTADSTSTENVEKSDEELQTHSAFEIFKYPNVAVCILLAILTLGAYFTMVIYAPLYLTEVLGYSVAKMGLITSGMGVLFVPYAILIPRITDTYGRKPVMIISILLSAIAPLLMSVFTQSMISVIGYILLGGVSGAIHVFFNTIIPMESLPDDLKTTGSSITISAGEIGGAAMIPVISGILSDKYGYVGAMLFAGVLFIAAFFISFALKESNKSIAN